ncbi:hypothetical protein ASE63_22600 [Bosea sp. Root381]|uniref:hypothetical protein n=1 Tax=Bosea sp. Root381 TaxID=1736524 RepID=UPI0006FD5E04|nr:hypothetical protein [Bosea sp. Root381]KRE07492.1 hypothetical protein ASE63_22600 [Bosea sp. Root381]
MTAPEPATDGEVEALRRGLDGVTPGPWEPGYALFCEIFAGEDHVASVKTGRETSAHIARCSPDAIARLLSRLTLAEETARSEKERADKAEAGKAFLKASYEALAARADDYSAKLTAAESTIASLQSQVEAMRSGLEQFANLADFYKARSDLDVVYIQISDLRRARSTLAAVEKEAGE